MAFLSIGGSGSVRPMGKAAMGAALTSLLAAAVGWLDGEPRVMTPALICVLDSVSGDAIGTETLRYGQRVTVIALPAPPILLTPKGIEHVGPRAFGYDLDFRSVFA